MMSCKEATELLSARQDVVLPWRQRMALRLHTAMCTGCAAFGRQMQDLSDISKLFVSDAGHGDESAKRDNGGS